MSDGASPSNLTGNKTKPQSGASIPDPATSVPPSRKDSMVDGDPDLTKSARQPVSLKDWYQQLCTDEQQLLTLIASNMTKAMKDNISPALETKMIESNRSITKQIDDLKSQQQILQKLVYESYITRKNHPTTEAKEEHDSEAGSPSAEEPSVISTSNRKRILESPFFLIGIGFLPGFFLALIALVIGSRSKTDPALQTVVELTKTNTSLLEKLDNRPANVSKIDPNSLKISLPDSTKQEIISAVKTIKPETAPTPSNAVDPMVITKIDELTTTLKNTKVGLPEGTLPAINKAADAIKAVDISSIKTLTAELQTKTKAEAESRLALEKAIAALQMAAGKVGTGATVSKPQDVWLIGLDSAKFTVKDYRQSFQDALGVFDRKAEATIRGGFGIARGDEFTVLGKPSDPMIKWNLVQPPPGGVVETPSGFGSSLKEQLDPARAKQRIILVGSIECPPLKSDTPGWSEIPEVHVVLVQKNKISAANERAALLDQLLAWQDFCHARKGTLTIIPDTNTDKPGRLKDVLQQLTKPE